VVLSRYRISASNPDALAPFAIPNGDASTLASKIAVVFPFIISPPFFAPRALIVTLAERASDVPAPKPRTLSV
jgi:hypothetical protein